MATAQQIKALLESYSESDDEMFVSVALQIAAHEARAGRGRFAAELKKLVDEIRSKERPSAGAGAVPIARPTGDLANLISASYPRTRLSEMVLGDSQRKSLELALKEYRQRVRLREHGLSARRKLLLVGPPGVGKTMTARALAGELRLPLFTVQFHSLITKFMGETAAKLFAVFEAMRSTRGVYLFDEFDAIGAMRTMGNDVGEIRRVLNSFLVFLEQDDSDSLVVAATNLENTLDQALFRRFDDVVQYSLPESEEIMALVQNHLARFQIGEGEACEVAKESAGLSHAEVCWACEHAAKVAVLSERAKVAISDLVDAVRAQKERKARLLKGQ